MGNFEQIHPKTNLTRSMVHEIEKSSETKKKTRLRQGKLWFVN